MYIPVNILNFFDGEYPSIHSQIINYTHPCFVMIIRILSDINWNSWVWLKFTVKAGRIHESSVKINFDHSSVKRPDNMIKTSRMNRRLDCKKISPRVRYRKLQTI